MMDKIFTSLMLGLLFFTIQLDAQTTPTFSIDPQSTSAQLNDIIEVDIVVADDVVPGDPDQRDRLAERFAAMSVATYAARFDGYSGQSFEVLDPQRGPQNAVIVPSRLVRPEDEPIALDYRMRQDDSGAWRIVDVYLKGRFSELARGWIREIEGRGRVPVLCGGTGLFLRSLTDPVFDEPDMDDGRREALEGWLEGLPREELRRWGRRLDPDLADDLEGLACTGDHVGPWAQGN